MTRTAYRLDRRAAPSYRRRRGRRRLAAGADRPTRDRPDALDRGAREGEHPDRLARPGRAWRLLPGDRHRPLSQGRHRVRGAPGRPQPQHQPAPAGRPGRHDHVGQLRGLLLCAHRRAVLHHRRDLPEGSAGADRPSRHRLRLLREAAGTHPADRRRRQGDLLALPAPEVRALRYPAQAVQLQPGAVPCRQDADPAGLPFVRALSDRPGARPGAVGAADRRCGLQRLPGHDRDLAQDGGGEEGSRAALRRRHARGLGAVHQGRARHRSGQRADQAGQPGADRRSPGLCHQGAGRTRHRDVGRCAEGWDRRHERRALARVSTIRWSRSMSSPRGSTSAAPIRWNS